MQDWDRPVNHAPAGELTFPINHPNGKAALFPRAVCEQEGWLAGAVT
jgi:hypothetical protein